MKTIKILLLILLAVLSMSCSEDNNVCNCIEVEEKASFPYNNYVLTGNEFPTEYSCDSDGYTYYTTSIPEEFIIYRNRVVCR
jgi:hypothetical protein